MVDENGNLTGVNNTLEDMFNSQEDVSVSNIREELFNSGDARTKFKDEQRKKAEDEKANATNMTFSIDDTNEESANKNQ